MILVGESYQCQIPMQDWKSGKGLEIDLSFPSQENVLKIGQILESLEKVLNLKGGQGIFDNS